MNTTELRALFRSEFSDEAEPFLIPDASVYAYISDAQRMFCRLTEGIEDGRSFTIAINAGTEWYPLDNAILKLRKVTDQSTGRAIEVVNQERAAERGVIFDGRAGPLRALVAGVEKGFLRAWPTPISSSTLVLETFRLPPPVAAGGNLEIDEQHHEHLLMWVKHRAYGNQDNEARDDAKAGEYAQRFRAYCAAALAEQVRARRVVGAVAYGGL